MTRAGVEGRRVTHHKQPPNLTEVDELREALAATSPQQVSAVELVDGEEFTDAVVDLLPAPVPGPTDRSPALLAQDLLSQVASPGTCRPALTLAPRTQRPHY